jgi:hypothetical protein
MQEELISNYCEIYDGDNEQATIEEYSDYIMSLSPDELLVVYNETFN